MLLKWIFTLSALLNVLPAGSIFCPDPETSDPNLTDCLGLRFTWLHSLVDNFPSLLNFASRLRCATGICPRDLEDYGCSCRFVAAGNPVDPLDGCCETHRLCYQNVAPCRQRLLPPPYNFTCAAVNSSCDAGDLCQQSFCECDQAAVDCMAQNPYNWTLRGFDESLCSAANQTDPLGGASEADEGFRGADVLSAVNDSASYQFSNSSFLSAEMDLLMTGGLEDQNDTVGMDGDLVTPPPGTPSLLTPSEELEEAGEEEEEEGPTHLSSVSKDLNEAVAEEALELEEIKKDPMARDPPEAGRSEPEIPFVCITTDGGNTLPLLNIKEQLEMESFMFDDVIN